jgi:hypothetical protein
LLAAKYPESHDARDWSVEGVKRNISLFGPDHIREILYRPFDFRSTYYTDFSRGFLAYPVYEAGRHLLQHNLALLVTRVTKDQPGALVADRIMAHKSSSRYDGTYFAPLYLYPSEQDLDQSRRVNFDPNLYARLRALATHPTLQGNRVWDLT